MSQWKIVSDDSLLPCSTINRPRNSSHQILSFYSWCRRDRTSRSQSSSFVVSASPFHSKVMRKKPRRLETTTVPTLRQQHLFVINRSTHNIFSLDPVTLSLITYSWYVAILVRLVYRRTKIVRVGLSKERDA
jgi:hypothetical protein